MRAREALHVHLHGNGPHGRPKVEKADLLDAEPAGQVVRVGQRRREALKADGLARLRGDVAHARDDDLEHGPALLAEQVHLVNNDEADLARVVAAPPAACDAVPLLRRRHDDVGHAQRLRVRRHVASELDDAAAQALAELALPVAHALGHECLERRDVDGLHARVRRKEAVDGQLRGECLAAARRRAK